MVEKHKFDDRVKILDSSDGIKIYERSAAARDFHLMSGNQSQKTTLFVCNEIVKNFPLEKNDVLGDIGCGDGTFLNLVDKKIEKSVGIAPTEKECMRLQKELPEISFKAGLAQNIPLSDNSLDKLVCNSVLLLMDESEVQIALKEFNRVIKNGGLAYIGEVPSNQEFEFNQSLLNRGMSRLKKDGVVKLTKMLFDVIKEKKKYGQIVRLQKHFLISPEDFISMAKENNLKILSKSRHNTLNIYDEIVNTDRWNYIFVKN